MRMRADGVASSEDSIAARVRLAGWSCVVFEQARPCRGDSLVNIFVEKLEVINRVGFLFSLGIHVVGGGEACDKNRCSARRVVL